MAAATIFPSMNRYLKWLALVAMVISLNSCGLPGALFRQTDNLVSTALTAAGGAP